MSSTVSPEGPVTNAQLSLNTIPSAGPVGTFPRTWTLDDLASGGRAGSERIGRSCSERDDDGRERDEHSDPG